MAGRLEVDRVPETHGTVECVEGDRPVTRRCGDAARAARERDAPPCDGHIAFSEGWMWRAATASPGLYCFS